VLVEGVDRVRVDKVVVDESVIEHKSDPYLIYQAPPAKAASGE
jgi:ATP-dependent Clp protease ATP-binding subunit ClpX